MTRVWKHKAGRRCALGTRKQLGVRVLVVDVPHEKAAAFYRLYGFRATA